MTKIFVYAPAKRATAADCMRHPFFADLFVEGTKLPNNVDLPKILETMRTPEEMLRNYPDGPVPPK